ncbi:MAG: antitoxin VapB [Bradyrhizobium sp.]|jgi:hypothetical protein|nr:antitoxin VapB [Bradyrhizobium sp.]
MAEQRHVKLFRNGRNRTVRIPVEFELPGDEAIMHRDGDGLRRNPLKAESGREAIGGNDLLIAAHAYATGATIVAANTDEFKRIRGLSVENWVA